MRTHQNGQNNNKKSRNFFVRNIYAFLLGFCVLAIAAVVILSIALKPKNPLDPSDPVVTPPAKITFVDPLAKCVLAKEASLEELVFSSTLQEYITHDGADFTAAVGDEVKCIANGTVESIENTALDGTVIVVAHQDGFKSVYKSLNSKTEVKVGDKVTASAKLGTVDNSMMIEQVDGVHLHLELLLNNVNVDPMDYIPFGTNK